MTKAELTAMVAEILGQMEPTVKGSDYRPTTPGPEQKETGYHDGDFVPDVTELDLRKLYLILVEGIMEGKYTSPFFITSPSFTL